MINGPEDWRADMDAWGLTGSQRTHHMWRLHTYHRHIQDVYWQRWERTDRAGAWLAFALLLGLVVGLVVML